MSIFKKDVNEIPSFSAVAAAGASITTIGADGDFVTLQEALDAGESIVKLLPGTHTVTQTIITDGPLSIIGSGVASTTLKSDGIIDIFKASNRVSTPLVAGTFTRSGAIITGVGTDFVNEGVAVGSHIRVGADMYIGPVRVMEVTATAIYLDDTSPFMIASGNATSLFIVDLYPVELTNLSINTNTRYLFGNAPGTTNSYISPTMINVDFIGEGSEFCEDGHNIARAYARHCNFAGQGGWAHYGSASNGMWIDCSIGMLWLSGSNAANNTYIGCYIFDFDAAPSDRQDISFIACEFGGDSALDTDNSIYLNPENGGVNLIACTFDGIPFKQKAPYYATAALPAPSSLNIGKVVWCTNGYAGTAGLVVSTGTSWVRTTDNLTVASAV